MFFNVLIEVDEKKAFNTDCYIYDAEKHSLSVHVPHQTTNSWLDIENVKCEIRVDRPLVYINVKTIKEE